jgi:hypothetical protein
MAATARLIVQMTPGDKAQLDRRARAAGISTAEFVRRRIGTDDIDDHRDEIEAMLSLLEEVAPRIQQTLDEAITAATAASETLDRIGRGEL